ncbi:MAG: YbhB/YbcL family Raf kinase inhibitor-like protein [Calditrichaeota bacterium]|nr:MAG: YbhB/YbcL family Raf kinase inhibitor-like protein [Calditrichota bacterium]
MSLKIYSSAFDRGERIPVKYTCDGPDLSPPLKWENLPEGTKSLVLICDDPDAPVGTWVHWVVYGIPPTLEGLEENVPRTETVKPGFRQGKNSWGRIGYGGPCPPKGKPHRYFFKLYAVDISTDWEAGLSKEEVLKRIEGHILAQAEWMGTYQR